MLVTMVSSVMSAGDSSIAIFIGDCNIHIVEFGAALWHALTLKMCCGETSNQQAFVSH